MAEILHTTPARTVREKEAIRKGWLEGFTEPICVRECIDIKDKLSIEEVDGQ